MDITFNKLLLILIPAICLAQPHSVHYSALGNYLVDENGQRTTIVGHPSMTCYQGTKEVHGKFQKARGATIWLISGKKYIEIKKPVCDIR